jgi:hypothetical protein
MTEDQAERLAEHEMDRLDRRFMQGHINQDTYDKEVRSIDMRARRRAGDWRRMRSDS